MPTGPPPLPLARKARRLAVLIGDAGGGAPGLADEYEFLEPVEIVRTAGGRDLDHAKFHYNLGKTGERIVDLQTAQSWNREIEVRLVSEAGIADAALLFWGENTVQSARINQRAEEAEVIAAVGPYHFGAPCTGYIVIDPTSGDPPTAVVTFDDDPVFNPEIDGIVEPNKSDLLHPDTGSSIWIHPESVRTLDAQIIQGTSANLWELKECIEAITLLLNENESYIANPTGVLTDPAFADAPAVKNLIVKRGHYLPAILDDILHPHGYDWYLSYWIDTADFTRPARRRIMLFKRGVGPEQELYLQRPGETLTREDTNLLETDLSWNIADLANSITAYGSHQEREITIELYKAWPEEDDGLASDLSKKEPGSHYHAKPNVWRKWVVNEAGDYSGLRPEIPLSATDLSAILDRYVPRRRVFGDLLTYFPEDDGKRRKDPFLEWDNGDGEGWRAVPEGWHVRLLGNELGIYFNDDEPPQELMAAGEDARVRITATVRGDKRATASAGVTETSANSQPVELILNVSNRYHDRQVQKTGAYVSVLNNTRFVTVTGGTPTTGTTTFSFDGASTSALAFGVTSADVETALEALPAIGVGNVEVTGGPYPDSDLRVRFVSALSDTTLPLTASSSFDAGTAFVTEYTADEADDAAALQTFVDTLQEIDQATKIEARFTLEDIETGYEIGNLITRINGRNIELDRNTPAAALPRYLQITGIRYVIGDKERKTVLTVESVEPPRPT